MWSKLSFTNLLPFEHNEELSVSWQFFLTYGVISYASGWRKDVVNYCCRLSTNEKRSISRQVGLCVCVWGGGGGGRGGACVSYSCLSCFVVLCLHFSFLCNRELVVAVGVPFFFHPGVLCIFSLVCLLLLVVVVCLFAYCLFFLCLLFVLFCFVFALFVCYCLCSSLAYCSFRLSSSFRWRAKKRRNKKQNIFFF